MGKNRVHVPRGRAEEIVKEFFSMRGDIEPEVMEAYLAKIKHDCNYGNSRRGHHIDADDRECRVRGDRKRPEDYLMLNRICGCCASDSDFVEEVEYAH